MGSRLRVQYERLRLNIVAFRDLLGLLFTALLRKFFVCVTSGRESFPLCPDERFSSAKLGKYVPRNSAKREKYIEFLCGLPP